MPPIQLNAIGLNRIVLELLCIIAICFQPTIVIYCQIANIFFPIEIQVVFAW
jgi:hypothetical protein